MVKGEVELSPFHGLRNHWSWSEGDRKGEQSGRQHKAGLNTATRESKGEKEEKRRGKNGESRVKGEVWHHVGKCSHRTEQLLDLGKPDMKFCVVWSNKKT